MDGLTIIGHPLIEHKLTLVRDRRTPTAEFRRLVYEISMLMTYEVLRDLELEEVEIETPLVATRARKLAGKKLCFVSILRAGEGLIQGLLDLVPSARVGHIGLYRDEKTLKPVPYYSKLPTDIAARTVVVVDPMLATGGTAAEAVRRIKAAGARDIRFVSLLAAPEGVRVFREAHPDVQVYTAALDERLNEKGYIVPGLGDAGDRLFGTR